MKDLSKEKREKLRSEIELFRALHEAHRLREENMRLQAKHGELNEFLQQRTASGWGGHVVDVAMAHIEKQESEIRRLREALKAVDAACFGGETYFEVAKIARTALVGEKIDR